MAQKWIKPTALILAGVGSLNWGLIALFNFNVVTFVSGLPLVSSIPMVTNVILGAVAVSGAYVLFEAAKK